MDTNIYNQNITILAMNRAAKWLRKKREGEGISYRTLGAAIGANHTTIVDAEEGKATIRTWIKLAEYFNESVLNVLHWAGEIKQPPSEQDVLKEIQDRLIIKIIETFPEDQREAVLSRMIAEVDYLYEMQKREKQSGAPGQRYS